MIIRFKPYKNKYIYQLPVAGHTLETIKIKYTIPNLMFVEGKVEKDLYQHAFYRILEIPRNYTSKDVKINLENGLLQLEIYSKDKV